MQMDGDKTTIFHDVDGSVSEYPGAFLVKEDNWLLRHPDCIDVPDWRAAICSGHYAQVRCTLETCQSNHYHVKAGSPCSFSLSFSLNPNVPPKSSKA